MQDTDIDPDINFFDHFASNCYYYTESNFIDKFKLDRGISMIHLNSRSMYKHFDTIKDYLCQFPTPFSIIAVSETWITTAKGTDFELEGYTHMQIVGNK